MVPKWPAPYTIIEVTVVGGYKLKDKNGHCLKTQFLTVMHKAVLPGNAGMRYW